MLRIHITDFLGHGLSCFRREGGGGMSVSNKHPVNFCQTKKQGNIDQTVPQARVVGTRSNPSGKASDTWSWKRVIV